jgi:hypothetical protein
MVRRPSNTNRADRFDVPLKLGIIVGQKNMKRSSFVETIEVRHGQTIVVNIAGQVTTTMFAPNISLELASTFSNSNPQRAFLTIGCSRKHLHHRASHLYDSSSRVVPLRAQGPSLRDECHYQMRHQYNDSVLLKTKKYHPNLEHCFSQHHGNRLQITFTDRSAQRYATGPRGEGENDRAHSMDEFTYMHEQ